MNPFRFFAAFLISFTLATYTLADSNPGLFTFTEPEMEAPDVAPTDCAGYWDPYTVGAGKEIHGSGTTPYTGFWEEGRSQYLFRAEELAAQGCSGGLLTAIGFQVAEKFSRGGLKIRIRMGIANERSISSQFQEGLKLVFEGVPETKAGNNTHLLHDPFLWDGRSDLLVEVNCQSDNWSDYDFVYATPTDFPSVLQNYTDRKSEAILSEGTVSRMRPNTRFYICRSLNEIFTAGNQTGIGLDAQQPPRNLGDSQLMPVFSNGMIGGSSTPVLLPAVGIVRLDCSGGDRSIQTNLYALPGISRFIFELSTSEGSDARIRVTDLAGKTISERPFSRTDKGNFQETIDLSGLNGGVYHYQIASGAGRTEGKLIVTR